MRVINKNENDLDYLIGIFGNSATEAMYPTYFSDIDGAPLDASAAAYTLTFAENELPPVKLFWP